jgi:hypothetical protein
MMRRWLAAALVEMLRDAAIGVVLLVVVLQLLAALIG